MSDRTIAMNPFAQRHTRESSLSYFEGREDVLLELIRVNFDKGHTGYKPGIWHVPLPARGFYSSILPVQDVTKIESRFDARRDNEEPYLSHAYIGGDKAEAQSAEVILYSHAVLAEGGDASTECDWEVVSINAEPGTEPSPMHPVTMARNFLNREGGTKGEFSAEDFAKSIEFWSTHVQLCP